ncbi:MAG: sensor histidine kinase [Salinibacterium sp.]|nr:sensor histidine kinase [Salinibacterium sp.]
MFRTLRLGFVVDVALVLGFLAIGWFGAADAPAGEPTYEYLPRDALFLVLLAASTLPGLAWRRWPTAAFVVSLVALTALWWLGYNASWALLILLVGAYWVSSTRPQREVALCGALVLISVTTLLIVNGAPFSFFQWLASIVSLGMVFALGRSSLLRGELADARAQAIEESALRRAGEERLRVSRELHDIVGHSLGIIAVQAGVGRHLMDHDPQRAADALNHIADVSRRSLDDMRSVVATLRGGGASYGPPRGLADLPELLETTRSTGLQVTLTMASDADPMPRQVGAAVYRVVREALTNVIRHARASRVDLSISLSEDRIELTVCDAGEGVVRPSLRAVGPGHGIAVMRERAEALGGTLSAEPQPAGGFAVRASFPAEPVR